MVLLRLSLAGNDPEIPRVVPVLVADQPRGEFQTILAQRHPVLLDQQHMVVVVDGEEVSVETNLEGIAEGFTYSPLKEGELEAERLRLAAEEDE